ncbi:hypothetical protein D3C84_1209070 [compost metagenome]
MPQVQSNTLDQAVKADLLSRHRYEQPCWHGEQAKLLSDKPTRDVILTVAYELLKKDARADFLGSARG